MSLRLRLSLILGTAFVLIWALAATWMFRDLRSQMMFSLDQRRGGRRQCGDAGCAGGCDGSR